MTARILIPPFGWFISYVILLLLLLILLLLLLPILLLVLYHYYYHEYYYHSFYNLSLCIRAIGSLKANTIILYH